MTREERRRQVIKNRISLGFIIAELILICVLIPIAINKFGDKNNEDTPVVIDPNDEQAASIIAESEAKNSSEKANDSGKADNKGKNTESQNADSNVNAGDSEKNTNEPGPGSESGNNETDTNTDDGNKEETPEKYIPANELIAAADIKAAMYDYDAAIEMVKSSPDYETSKDSKEAVARYEAAKAKCVKWSDNTKISHIFVHSLIVDTSRAFGPKSSQPKGYNQYMTTVSEFNKMLESMYERGYVLVSIHDIAKVETDENGNKKLVQQDIMLPPGKEPFVLSQDDVNYYLYMDNDGFADKLVIGEDGIPTCQYTDADGNVMFGEYDVLPIVDRFLKEHPDFSYRGAKGILAVTGYEGALGYDTGLSMKIYDGLSEEEKMKRINEEREKAKAVADAIKADGWEFASHSYTHSNMTNATVEKLEYDSKRWHEEVEIILGPTDIYIYPYGADICDWHGYKGEKYELLKKYGFWYFCNVDASRYWIQIRDGYFRMGRINTDGERMHITMKNRSDPSLPDRLGYFFVTEDVYDYSRPAWD